MSEKTLTPQTTMYGKVVIYKCKSCGQRFPMHLLDGAVAPDVPPPLIVQSAFQNHDCAVPSQEAVDT
jgi:hypothetical protein